MRVKIGKVKFKNGNTIERLPNAGINAHEDLDLLTAFAESIRVGKVKAFSIVYVADNGAFGHSRKYECDYGLRLVGALECAKSDVISAVLER